MKYLKNEEQCGLPSLVAAFALWVQVKPWLAVIPAEVPSGE